ncbi:MAG: hypothetical protein AB7S78_01155 [Candidatus Omnitrophota bacterium]
MDKFWAKLVLVFLILNLCPHLKAQNVSLSAKDRRQISDKVFQNECSGKEECLLAWNAGEEFMSLGIGHFIWYPQGQTGPFDESFPKFLEYLQSTGQKIPGWLQHRPGCPWTSREDFLKNRQGVKAGELKHLLLSTKEKQGDFLIKRLNEALPLMLKNSPPEKRKQLREQFYRVSGTPAGIFALVDYVNFKGLGTSLTERYQGQGWGLMQILSDMPGQGEGRAALEEFVQTAEKMLVERVKNAPAYRNEEKWLPGWKRRVNSYLEFRDEQQPQTPMPVK